MVCENPRCTVVPLTQPALHIADKDPIPEEQVMVKTFFFPLKKSFPYKAYLSFSVSGVDNYWVSC